MEEAGLIEWDGPTGWVLQGHLYPKLMELLCGFLVRFAVDLL